MKKIGNISSVTLSLGLAFALAFMLIEPNAAQIDRLVEETADKTIQPTTNDLLETTLSLQMVTLPPPPQVLSDGALAKPTEINALSTKKISSAPTEITALQALPTPTNGTVNAPPVSALKAITTPSKMNSLQPNKLIPLQEEIDFETSPETLEPLNPIEPSPLVGKVEAVENTSDDAPSSNEVEVTITKNSQDVKTGRTLLKLLEYGNGPSIDIAWPDTQRHQKQLQSIFNRCFGMVSAIMTSDGKLYKMGNPRGQIWHLSIDKYSGFIRQPSGNISKEERVVAKEIRRHHNIGSRNNIVRVFPRQIDAIVLGGLQRLIGTDYKKSSAILATYQIQNGGLKIKNLYQDGKPISGNIAIDVNKNCQREYMS